MLNEPRSRATSTLRSSALALLLCGAGCKPHHKAVSTDVSPPQSTPGAIPDAPVSGKVFGVPFTVKTARYYVDQRRGFEKIDVILSASEATEACGPLVRKDAPSVWLRRRGAERVTQSEARITPGEKSAWEVHYQAKEEKQWVGSGTAAALVAVRALRPDKTIDGDLSACFADESKSCVSGAFSAVYCPIGIDAPVRGTEPPEPIPEKFRRAFGGSVPPQVAPGASSQAGAR